MNAGFGQRPRLWNTGSVEPHRAFRFWVHVVCAELLELEVSTRDPGHFEASLVQMQLGPIQLSRIYTRETQDVRRTLQAIGRTARSQFELVYVLNGRLDYRHYGRTFTVASNECALIDSSEPFAFNSAPGTSGTSLQMPTDWLRGRISRPEAGVAQVICETAPWGSAVLATMRTLSTLPIDSFGAGEVISEQVAGLLELALDQMVDATDSQRSGGRFREVIRLMHSWAHEDTLDPERVAALGGMSKRSLHALLAAAGTSFRRELLGIRLERARRQLEDPKFSRVRVSDVGWRCGFVDASHFARRFTQRFGLSPRAFRRQVLRRRGAD